MQQFIAAQLVFLRYEFVLLGQFEMVFERVGMRLMDIAQTRSGSGF